MIQLEVDLPRNMIVLTLEQDDGGTTCSTPARLDVGAGGRLLGLDLGRPLPGVTEDGYIELFPPLTSDVRTAPVELLVTERDGRVTRLDLPRRGEGYEITYPSGNQ